MRASAVPVDGFALPAAVREVRYAGGSVEIFAAMKDGSEAVATSDQPLADAPKAGETVYLNWAIGQAAVIGGASHDA